MILLFSFKKSSFICLLDCLVQVHMEDGMRMATLLDIMA